MNKLISATKACNKFSKLINDPRAKKIAALAKDNWREVAAIAALALIIEDVDTAADYAQASLTLDVMTAITEGVIS